MTAAPEGFLAREAELCYATIAHVTDYDVWHTDETVSADLVFKRFQNNVQIAQQTIAQAVERIAALPRGCGCKSALANSFATARERITPEIKARLRPIIGPYFPE